MASLRSRAAEAAVRLLVRVGAGEATSSDDFFLHCRGRRGYCLGGGFGGISKIVSVVVVVVVVVVQEARVEKAEMVLMA